jgi:hypothetical protein
MLKMDPGGRLPAGECLEAAPELFQAMLPMSGDETEVMTPTVEADQNLDDPNRKETETQIGYSTFTPGNDHQLSPQIWIQPTDFGPPSTARGTLEEEPYRVAEQANHADEADEEERLPPLPTYATRGPIGRQLMGPLDERSEMVSTSIQQEMVLREQASTQILIGESLVQLPVKGKFVSMRKLDYWLNATEILVLAGKNEKQIK